MRSPAVAALLLVACNPTLDLGEQRVTCLDQGDCFGGTVCNQAIGRCVDPAADLVAPSLVGASLEPPVGGVGTVFVATITLNEPLDHPPEVRLDGVASAWSIDEPASSPAEGRYVLTYTATGREPPSSTVSALVFDTVGNSTEVVVGQLVVDTTTPQGTVDWLLDPDQRAIGAIGVVSAVVVYEQGVELTSAAVVDDSGVMLHDLLPTATLDPDGASQSATLTFAMEDVDLSGATAIAVSVTLRDGLGNASAPGALRTRYLALDNVPPSAPTVTVVGGTVTESQTVTLTVGAPDATRVHFSTDPPQDLIAINGLNPADVAVPPGQATFGVTLQLATVAGAGVTIAVVARDAAFNASPKTEVDVAIGGGSVLSAPRIVLPANQTMAKNGDLLTIAGVGTLGATVKSARVIDSATNTVMSLAAGTVILDEDTLTGSFVLAGAPDGSRLRLEVILTLNSVDTAPSGSRSRAVEVDLTPPAPLRLEDFALAEKTNAGTDFANSDPSFNTFTIMVEPTTFGGPATLWVRTCGASEVLRSVAVDMGVVLSNITGLPHDDGHCFELVLRDEAGNEVVAELQAPRLALSLFATRVGDRVVNVLKAGEHIDVKATILDDASTPTLFVIDRNGGSVSRDPDESTPSGGGATHDFDVAAAGTEQEGVNILLAEVRVAMGRHKARHAAALSYDFTAPSFSSGSVCTRVGESVGSVRFQVTSGVLNDNLSTLGGYVIIDTDDVSSAHSEANYRWGAQKNVLIAACNTVDVRIEDAAGNAIVGDDCSCQATL